MVHISEHRKNSVGNNPLKGPKASYTGCLSTAQDIHALYRLLSKLTTMHNSPLAYLSFFSLPLLALFPLLSIAHPAAVPEVAKTYSATNTGGHRPGHTIEHGGVTHKICGTEEAAGHIVTAHKDLAALHKKQPDHRILPRGQLVHVGDLWDVVKKEKRMSKRKATVGNSIVVETYVHYVSSSDQKDAYTPEQIASMVAQQVHLSAPPLPVQPSFINCHQR